MTDAESAAALRDALWLMLKIGGPLLLAALAVGLIVSLLQTITQINEPTLVFLPKVLILGGAMALLGPFMMDQITTFTLSLMDKLVSIGGQ